MGSCVLGRQELAPWRASFLKANSSRWRRDRCSNVHKQQMETPTAKMQMRWAHHNLKHSDEESQGHLARAHGYKCPIKAAAGAIGAIPVMGIAGGLPRCCRQSRPSSKVETKDAVIAVTLDFDHLLVQAV